MYHLQRPPRPTLCARYGRALTAWAEKKTHYHRKFLLTPTLAYASPLIPPHVPRDTLLLIHTFVSSYVSYYHAHLAQFGALDAGLDNSGREKLAAVQLGGDDGCAGVLHGVDDFLHGWVWREKWRERKRERMRL